MKSIYLATVETRSWTFEAAGSTAASARALLRCLFLTHMATMGGTLTWNEIADEVSVREVSRGATWIDGQEATL